MLTRQNRTLFAIIVFAAVVVGFMYWQYGRMMAENKGPAILLNDEKNLQDADRALEQEELGTVLGTNESQSAVAQRNFAMIAKDLFECLDIKGQGLPDSLPVTVDAFVMAIQTELGPSSSMSDHWMNWHLKNRDGQERRLRLEVNDGDEGHSVRELKYFSLDKEGLPVILELDKAKAINPSDEVINQMLKEGDVFYKEKSGVVNFSGGERFEYVEKNGELSEIEFYRGENFFRCQNLRARENCQCVR